MVFKHIDMILLPCSGTCRPTVASVVMDMEGSSQVSLSQRAYWEGHLGDTKGAIALDPRASNWA